MKKIRLCLLAALVAAVCALGAACGDFAGYDDDGAIVKGSSSSRIMSRETKTLSSYSLKCDKLDGVLRIKDIKVPENPVFELTFSFEGGRCKAVLVKDNAVTVICAGNTEGPVSLTLAAGTYSLRLVAEAAANVSFTFQYNDYNT